MPNISLYKHLRSIEKIVHLLDTSISVGKFKFGLDPLIGLVPVLGDIIPTVLSLYMLYIGIQAKIPPSTLLKMVWHMLLDLSLGSIPIAGDAVDFFYKSHLKNLELLKRSLPDYTVHRD